MKKPTAPEEPMKISPWAQKGMQEGNVAPVKFAPLEKTEPRFLRQQQEYVFVSKKEQEERKKKREEREQTEKVVPKP